MATAAGIAALVLCLQTAAFAEEVFLPDQFSTPYPRSMADFRARLKRFTAAKDDERRVVIVGPSYAREIELGAERAYNLAIDACQPQDMLELMRRYQRSTDMWVYICTVREAVYFGDEVRVTDFLTPKSEAYLARAWVKEKMGVPIGGSEEPPFVDARFQRQVRECLQGDARWRFRNARVAQIARAVQAWTGVSMETWDTSFVEQFDEECAGDVVFVLHPILQLNKSVQSNDFGRCINRFVGMAEVFRREMQKKNMVVLDMSHYGRDEMRNASHLTDAGVEEFAEALVEKLRILGYEL